MAKKPVPMKKKPFPLLLALLAGLVLAVLLTGGGFAFAASQESHDPFCGSCHSQPESTFLQRSTGAQPVDLASFHTTKQTLCIDCHSGEGLSGRLSAELMGAKNALKWYTGTAVQPAPLTAPIGDANCLKCHANVTQRGFAPKESIAIPSMNAGGRGEGGRSNHWHEFLSRWQASSASAGTCNSCHFGHLTDGTAKSGFMIDAKTTATCTACHRVLQD